MILPFQKYHGTGNDFIIVDNRNGLYDLIQEQVAFLCHRRFGIGADGLMLLQNHAQYDFEMRYFNSDGAEASMCGNGGRCLVRFAFEQGACGQNTSFLAVDGVHQAVVKDRNIVELKMSDVHQISHKLEGIFLDTGSPHYVEHVKNLDNLRVNQKGKEIRYHELFTPGGCNVNFVEKKGDDSIFVRTYERGVENETLSCGTGVVASALATYYMVDSKATYFDIETKGGNLSVRFSAKKHNDTIEFSDIWLCGPAQLVFKGTIDLH